MGRGPGHAGPSFSGMGGRTPAPPPSPREAAPPNPRWEIPAAAAAGSGRERGWAAGPAAPRGSADKAPAAAFVPFSDGVCSNYLRPGRHMGGGGALRAGAAALAGLPARPEPRPAPIPVPQGPQVRRFQPFSSLSGRMERAVFKKLIGQRFSCCRNRRQAARLRAPPPFGLISGFGEGREPAAGDVPNSPQRRRPPKTECEGGGVQRKPRLGGALVFPRTKRVIVTGGRYKVLLPWRPTPQTFTGGGGEEAAWKDPSEGVLQGGERGDAETIFLRTRGGLSPGAPAPPGFVGEMRCVHFSGESP